jgi:hypothetical protein
VLRPKSAEDGRVIMQAAILAAAWSEHWFYDALEAVRRADPKPENLIAYFRTCLVNKAREPPIEADFDNERQNIRITAEQVRDFLKGNL